ncbi:MAG TPA: LemA family protein [Methylomirabilota bacterium]|nr:LemA family protein [Methylomirabilota bacterium]
MNILLIAAVAALALWAGVIYNRLVSLRNRSDGAWSDIDVQLKRRHDLVANLVDAVRAYAGHERETLQAVVEARVQAEDAVAGGDAAAAGVAESRLGRRLGSLIAVVEGYPELKANENYLDLQRQLGVLEDALQNARRYYNAVVRDLNTRIQSLPDVIVARAAGFSERAFFELDDPSEAAVPRVGGGTE